MTKKNNVVSIFCRKKQSIASVIHSVVTAVFASNEEEDKDENSSFIKGYN